MALCFLYVLVTFSVFPTFFFLPPLLVFFSVYYILFFTLSTILYFQFYLICCFIFNSFFPYSLFCCIFYTLPFFSSVLSTLFFPLLLYRFSLRLCFFPLFTVLCLITSLLSVYYIWIYSPVFFLFNSLFFYCILFCLFQSFSLCLSSYITRFPIYFSLSLTLYCFLSPDAFQCIMLLVELF
jgi:hypothetical protein